MRKKIIAIILVAMVSSLTPMGVLAAEKPDGTAAAAPYDSHVAENSSYGSATLTSDDGLTFNAANDDDDLANEADTDGADINVWAKVIDSSTPVYKIDIAWGAMKFEYSSGEGLWNTATHTYDGATGTGAWTTTGYLDDETKNNTLTVTNHSNVAVDTNFDYTMDLAEGASKFNADAASTDAVVGNFFATKEAARTAAGVIAGTYSEGVAVPSAVPNKLTKIQLHNADKYYASAADKGTSTAQAVFTDANKVSTGREKNVYFAFSGKPDSGVGATLDNFTKVGVITVTVSKMSSSDLSAFEY